MSDTATSMTALNVHFSSATDLWATPQDFFDALDAEHAFTLDVCACAENAKCARFYTREQDGLAQHWSGTCWMNPPYGREIGKWVRKAYESARGGGDCCLLAARQNGHCMVARLRSKGRHHVHPRQIKVRRQQKFGAVPQCGCGVQAGLGELT